MNEELMEEHVIEEDSLALKNFDDEVHHVSKEKLKKEIKLEVKQERLISELKEENAWLEEDLEKAESELQKLKNSVWMKAKTFAVNLTGDFDLKDLDNDNKGWMSLGTNFGFIWRNVFGCGNEISNNGCGFFYRLSSYLLGGVDFVSIAASETVRAFNLMRGEVMLDLQLGVYSSCGCCGIEIFWGVGPRFIPSLSLNLRLRNEPRIRLDFAIPLSFGIKFNCYCKFMPNIELKLVNCFGVFSLLQSSIMDLFNLDKSNFEDGILVAITSTICSIKTQYVALCDVFLMFTSS